MAARPSLVRFPEKCSSITARTYALSADDYCMAIPFLISRVARGCARITALQKDNFQSVPCF
jgi:hypothetical protein